MIPVHWKKKRSTSQRCCAAISGRSLTYLRGPEDADPRCKRYAMTEGLCYQHLAMIRYCAAPGCHLRAKRKEGRWWFCARHARLWADHNEIVERIRRIPPRP